jgi:4-amino-4-deoxy-L-arabinose transferase-like glycosyltransferase
MKSNGDRGSAVTGQMCPGLLSLAAVLAGVVFLYPLTLSIPLLDPDEGLHAAIAREMVESGDWVVPRFLGEPFLDKPILYFWAQAASLSLFGMHEAAVRLPGLFFGLLGAVTTGIVAWRMLGRTIGLVAAVLYTTTILPTALAQAAAHDVALVPWVNLAVLGFWEADRAKTRRAAVGWTLAVGLLLGLAILTKGLAGVAVVGVAYGGYLLLTRRLNPSACLRGAAALLLGAGIASVWYLAVETRQPGFLHYYFVERHLLGFTTGTQSHGAEPWWYYLPILLGGGLPWIAYMPVTVCDQWARRRAADDPTVKLTLLSRALTSVRAWWKQLGDRRADGAGVLLWCWLLGGLMFFSASSSKLVTYIWPLFPPMAVLAAVAWGRLIEGALSPVARKLTAQTLIPSCIAGPAVLPVALLVAQSEFTLQFSWPVWLMACAAGACSLVPLFFWLGGRYRVTLVAATLSTALQFAVVMTAVLPPVARQNSAWKLAAHFNRTGRVPSRLVFAEERVGSLAFYLDDHLLRQVGQGGLTAVRVFELDEVDPAATIVLPERRLDRAAQHVDLAQRPYELVGRHRLYRAADLLPRLSAVESTPAGAASTSARRGNSREPSGEAAASAAPGSPCPAGCPRRSMALKTRRSTPICVQEEASSRPSAPPTSTSLGKWKPATIR